MEMTEINADELLLLPSAAARSADAATAATAAAAPAVPEPTPVPQSDIQPHSAATEGSQQREKKRKIDPINHARDDRATKVRKAEQWGANHGHKNSPLGPASVCQQNRSKHIANACLQEQQQLYLKSKHSLPGVPLPSVLSSLLQHS